MNVKRGFRAVDSSTILRNDLLKEGKALLQELQEESARNGTDDISINEINALISRSRQER